MAKQKLDALTDEQLVHHELELERQLLAASFRLRTGQLDDTESVGRLRRDIARARTAQRSREIAQGLAKDSLRGRYRATFEPGGDSAPDEKGSAGGFLKGFVDKISG